MLYSFCKGEPSHNPKWKKMCWARRKTKIWALRRSKSLPPTNRLHQSCYINSKVLVRPVLDHQRLSRKRNFCRQVTTIAPSRNSKARWQVFRSRPLAEVDQAQQVQIVRFLYLRDLQLLKGNRRQISCRMLWMSLHERMIGAPIRTIQGRIRADLKRQKIAK